MNSIDDLPAGAQERMSLRASLVEREAELARVQQIAGVGGLEVDLRGGFRNRRSPEYLRIHGLPQDAARETHEEWVGRIHPEDREATLGHFLDAVRSGAREYRAEYRIIRPSDGAVRWIAAVAEIERDEAGVPLRLVGAHRDVTERKCAEIALRESELQKRLALDAAGLGIWEYRPDSGALTADARCKALFGLAPEAEVGPSTLLDACHPEDRPRLRAALAAATDPGGPGGLAQEHRTLGGSGERWIVTRGHASFEGGRCVRLIGVVLEVTERKWAEAALRESRDRLAAERHALEVLNRTGTRIAAERDLGGLVRIVAEAGLALTGAASGAFVYRADEPGEEAPRCVLAGRDQEAFARGAEPLALAALAGGEPPDPGEVRAAGFASLLTVPVISASGETTGVLVLGHPAPGAFDARIAAVLTGLAAQAAIGFDNVRLLRAAHRANASLEQRVEERTAALRRAEEALRQSQKMEAVGQLTGGLAHDFNNLLTGIAGSLELLQLRLRQGRLGEIDRYVEAAQGAAKRAAALTHRLLAFSRRQTLDPKPVDANRLIAGMEELIRRTVGPAIAVEVAPAADLWTALVDPHQLENALLNLCLNARDAMPDGGRIVIATANLALGPEEAAAADLSPGPYLSLSVADTGIGMTPDVIQHAFEPFFTTKPMGQGTGLGLSMIYGFARQSGGQVRIASEVGRGTRVCLLLPRHEGAAEEVDGPLAPMREPRAGRGETVLVVDDEPTVRMLVTDVLEGLGYAVLAAGDGAAGLRLLREERRIALLVTDVGLPGGLNGRQMADAARADRPDLRVLFITGYAENAALGGGRLGPGMQVLTKPFAVETLAARVKELLAR
ncbi:PAS domain-containing protein [Methylobacterium sp. WSM2598]|uniref:PAS domain-containing protein n=1 Tax=Methylobacterium sp. WSM2598 TaxID=398261 RepID=UPI00037C801B|nr:PAS domain-containing protein [Methylobacterium sp. WSM2598]